MPSAQDYEQSMVAQLAITDPQMDTGLGTPIRKLISAVATEIANYAVDATTTQTLYALNAVSGQELDYLVGQFGFTRQEARAARGTVKISRDNGDSLLQVSYGSQFYKPASSVSPAIVFQTTAYQELAEGVLTAEIAVTAITAGSSGNVPANTITYSNAYTGYITATNENPTTGGRDVETDDELRNRFLNTVFRNESGTKDQYLGLSLAHAQVSRANVIGQESRYSEVVQVKASGDVFVATVSSNRWDVEVLRLLDPMYRYWVRNTDTDTLLSRGEYEVMGQGNQIQFYRQDMTELVGPVVIGESLSLSHKHVSSLVVVKSSDGSTAKLNADYTADLTNGVITIPSTTTLTAGESLRCSYKYYAVSEGDFVTIEFDYLSKLNRGELKSVELYIDGLDVQKVSDIQYLDFSKAVSSSNQSTWLREDNTVPVIGHLYVPLSYQPAYASTGMVNVGTSTILEEGTHFRMLYDQTKKQGSARGIDSIELLGTVKTVSGEQKFVFEGTKQPNLSDETPMNIPYYYNDVVETVQKLIDAQSVVTMDTLVHEAKRRYFGIYLTLMFSTFPRDDIKASVVSAAMKWAKLLPFGAPIQISDIETVAANVAGVDNVRVSNQTDAGNKKVPFVSSSDVGAFGIVECARDGETFVKQYTTDFQLAQNEVFEVQFVEIYSRTQQDWN